MNANSVLSRINLKSCVRLVNVGDGHLWHHPTKTFSGVENLTAVSYIGGAKLKNWPRFNCEVLMVRKWNKNGVYYNLDLEKFPKVKQIIFDSHPCEPSVLFRFPGVEWITRMPPPSYFIRYADELIHTILPDSEFEALDKHLITSPNVVTLRAKYTGMEKGFVIDKDTKLN